MYANGQTVQIVQINVIMLDSKCKRRLELLEIGI